MKEYRKTVWLLAILFAVLVVADSFITWWAINHGYPELNLLIAPIAHTWQLAAGKIIVSLIVSGMAIWITEKFTKIWKPVPIVFTFFFIPFVGFMGWVVVSNIINIWFK